jgi:hypothetical protein
LYCVTSGVELARVPPSTVNATAEMIRRAARPQLGQGRDFIADELSGASTSKVRSHRSHRHS